MIQLVELRDKIKYPSLLGLDSRVIDNLVAVNGKRTAIKTFLSVLCQEQREGRY